MTDGLTERDRQGILSVLEGFPKIRRAVLFGSRAIGTFRGASDLDLALEGDDLNLADLVAVRSRIGRLELPIEADLVIRAKITNSDVEKHIQKNGRMFYERKTTRNNLSGWREMTLREAGVSLIDCDHRTPPPSETGYPYVAIPQLKQGRLDLSDARRITREHFVEWTRKANPQPNDVVLSRRCNPGETAYVPPGLEVALGQNLVLLRADESKMFPPFLRWLVRGEKWWEQVGKFINVGAVFESLRCADIPEFQLPIPPLPEQRAIASVLGSLDDKIELNRRMNETLEALAQSLFKSWFVDATQSALPKGWRESTLEDAIVIHDSKRIPLSSRERALRRGKYPYHGAASVMDYVDDFLFDGVYTLIGEDGSVVNDDDTPVLQYVWGKFWVNNHAHVLTGKNGVSVEHLFLFLKTVNIRPFVTGAVQPKLNQGNLCRVPFALPPESVCTEFAQHIEPIFARIRANIEESRTLATLRDELLPKLLSGEVRVDQPSQ